MADTDTISLITGRRFQHTPSLRELYLSPMYSEAVCIHIPSDVWLEIANHLGPVDVLYLSRTCRRLNELLMSRASGEPIWRAARLNIPGLPDCPQYVSEAQYAQALFTFECQRCATPSPVKHHNYWLCTRLCNRCVDLEISKGTYLLNTIPGLTEPFIKTILSALDYMLLLFSLFVYYLIYAPDYRHHPGFNTKKVDQFYFVPRVKLAVRKFRLESLQTTPDKPKDIIQQRAKSYTEYLKVTKKLTKWCQEQKEDGNYTPAAELHNRRRRQLFDVLRRRHFSNEELESCDFTLVWEILKSTFTELTDNDFAFILPEMTHALNKARRLTSRVVDLRSISIIADYLNAKLFKTSSTSKIQVPYLSRPPRLVLPVSLPYRSSKTK
ncbi:hypothetical protein M422DRAFT_786272 [Sphaerobolus stellatus SS14]|uniref:F-box domain-containing protein n=1 Tax=Sphaerobolus stellatus (strain SS14) TaxID=990650 RepID=A0A0C9TMM0_SPHS4|nr:hypothetical protein M422DRAFT_786272 [Sphaerobolus stellatus SS14]